MKMFGISGWSGSGKTTLLVRLIPVLVSRGLCVATIKHSHHVPQLGDGETAALAAAGAAETLVAGDGGFALLHPVRGAEPGLQDLAARIDGGVDLLLVEGFKFSRHPKLEVWDPALGKDLLAAADDTVVAVACDSPVPDTGRPVFARDDVAGIAGFIIAACGLDRP